MKKKIVVLLASALMALSAGNALAFFGTIGGNPNDLVQVVYDANGNTEVATDLGALSNYTGSVTFDLGSTFLSTYFAGKSYTDLNVAYFAYKTGSDFWGSSTATPAGVTATNIGGAITKAGNVNSYYFSNPGSGTSATLTGTKTDTNSYFSQMDGTNVGAFGALLNPATGEASLAALATNGSTTVNLYDFKLGSRGAFTTTNALSITTDVTSGAAPTPIPPAFFLMGSGLLGMVGLRRKKN